MSGSVLLLGDFDERIRPSFHGRLIIPFACYLLPFFLFLLLLLVSIAGHFSRPLLREEEKCSASPRPDIESILGTEWKGVPIQALAAPPNLTARSFRPFRRASFRFRTSWTRTGY